MLSITLEQILELDIINGVENTQLQYSETEKTSGMAMVAGLPTKRYQSFKSGGEISTGFDVIKQLVLDRVLMSSTFNAAQRARSQSLTLQKFRAPAPYTLVEK
ncbi:hypothetical protein SARC_10199 [Sphaeroforma arctica JP610]|uniref:Uncharacterized protein n=1 Tax=Sphaeroforma arctica JP610 TaxID=667725 RepID=A0A0L0FKP3_9EUKA|nr:hypothetical protein SARC_10199 [Sphaeroforma arctica JP610]KNC77340.1 hypothetical protein SARC_10199 [Sphaeroforma arctica JP610]|eukprot:XP_014151242.1 hypothetical protein SARC_10199 [Sphaeroforma arctica JP610]